MDAPKCRLCGVKGWNHQCDGPVPAKSQPEKVDMPVVSTPPSAISTKISAAERTRRWRAENRDRYNVYMRKYRRRKRDEVE